MTLDLFWRSTLGEIMAVIGAYHRRQRDMMAGQVSAIMRALGAAFGEGTDPFQGLIDNEPSVQISRDQAKWARFWS